MVVSCRHTLRSLFGALVLMALSGAGLPNAHGAELGAARSAADEAARRINAAADEVLAYMQRTSAYVRLVSGQPIQSFDDVSFEEAQRRSVFYRGVQARLQTIDLTQAPHPQWLLARMLEHACFRGIHGEEDYWFTFAVTPYVGGQQFLGMHQILAGQPLQTAAQRADFLKLLDSYAVVVDQIRSKTLAQAARGIRVPRPAIGGVRSTLGQLRDDLPTTLAIAPSRLTNVGPEEGAVFQALVAKRIAERISPAYERLLALFDQSYEQKAPADVGLGRYPGGQASYLRRITYETTLSLKPEEIHAQGLAAVADLEAQMQVIRDQLGFKGDRGAFHEQLRHDPRFVPKTAAQIEQTYLRHIKRIEPHLAEYFSHLPKASYGVKRLDESNEKGMTYGLYQPPTPAMPIGLYRYNGSQLDQRTLLTSAHLIYHELVPGHHLHRSLQYEDHSAHAVVKFLQFGAFNEGWAEYAVSLAGEMGGLDDPYDRYGDLLMQSFAATRLVVDTGMNYLGWPLERGRAYMKAHTFETDVTIGTETLRYSTDMYAQALNYRLGREQFVTLRRKAQAALGTRFDIRDFNQAAVGYGAMPLDALSEHIDWYIAQKQPSPSQAKTRLGQR